MCLAIPGKLEQIIGDDPIFRDGMVRFGGIVKKVNLSYMPEAALGDYLIIHAGFAISKLDEKEALTVLQYISDIETELSKESQ